MYLYRLNILQCDKQLTFLLSTFNVKKSFMSQTDLKTIPIGQQRIPTFTQIYKSKIFVKNKTKRTLGKGVLIRWRIGTFRRLNGIWSSSIPALTDWSYKPHLKKKKNTFLEISGILKELSAYCVILSNPLCKDVNTRTITVIS